jgi:hypothetical protein
MVSAISGHVLVLLARLLSSFRSRRSFCKDGDLLRVNHLMYVVMLNSTR